jgi:hypothetical protein
LKAKGDFLICLTINEEKVMEAIKSQVEFVEINADAAKKLSGEVIIELNDLELALVGGGVGDVNF